MKDIQTYYDNDYHNLIHGNLLADDNYYWARAEAFNRLYFTKAENSPALKVLDYGCGLGQASAALPAACGYDASAQARAFAKKTGLTVYDTVAAIPAAAFDIIICRHVLEHLPEPGQTLQHLHGFLKPGGLLKLILPKEKHAAASFTADDHLHLYSWNFRAINNLLSVSGYEVAQNKTLYHWGFAKLLPLRRLAGPGVYLAAAKAVGQLFGAGELYIEAKKP